KLVAGTIVCAALAPSPGHLSIVWQIVRPSRDPPPGTVNQLGRPAALGAMAGYPFHFAVEAGVAPVLQVLLVDARVRIAYAQLLKTQLGGDRPDAVGQGGVVGRGMGHRLGYLLGQAYNCARPPED